MFGKKKSVAGLDIGSSSIKMVELEGKLNNLNLVSLGFENLPGDTIIDGQIMELNVVSDVIRSVCVNHQVTADTCRHRRQRTFGHLKEHRAAADEPRRTRRIDRLARRGTYSI